MENIPDSVFLGFQMKTPDRKLHGPTKIKTPGWQWCVPKHANALGFAPSSKLLSTPDLDENLDRCLTEF